MAMNLGDQPQPSFREADGRTYFDLGGVKTLTDVVIVLGELGYTIAQVHDNHVPKYALLWLSEPGISNNVWDMGTYEHASGFDVAACNLLCGCYMCALVFEDGVNVSRDYYFDAHEVWRAESGPSTSS